MISKIFKGVWAVSLLAYMAVLIYAYASLPEEVEVLQAGSKMYLQLGRDSFFYLFLSIAAVSNFLVYQYYNLKSKNPEDGLLTWVMSIGLSLNAFYIVSMYFISVYNSGEVYNYTNLGYILIMSIALILIVAMSWPFYSLIKKILIKA